jgi:cytochrome c oxidase subunit IV
MTDTAHQSHSKKTYIKVWMWLLFITLAGFIISPLQLPGAVHTFLIVMVALMKAGLIVAFFMHLKFEKIGLIYSILLPLILLIALVVALLYEGTTSFL